MGPAPGRRLVCTALGVLVGLVASNASAASAASAAQPDTGSTAIIVVDRDDVVVRGSAIVQFTGTPIHDDEGDGVLHIEGDDAVVRLIGTLRGADFDAAPETMTGVGISVRGRNASIAGGRIEGFRVGLEAIDADGLALVEMSFADGYRQRLESTPQAEAGSDWLFPHANDGGEWARQHGAAIRVVGSADVSLRELTVRRWQNGLMLERVTDSVVADCDASFLSGWGLAMWRVERSLVGRNAFDFCIRGYSHGVYNRGQDSAGILMFEQNSDNVIVRNSATHGGDGLFAFAGKEALGDVPEEQRKDPDWYRGRGNSGNLIAENDFSHAAAHGLELTFSHGNRITANRLVGNAICGIWGGFSQDTIIDRNVFEANGDAGYGLERGGVNIEHGRGNRITSNTFRDNACGVHLWNDPADGLYALPWGRANDPGSRDTMIDFNRFRGDAIGIELRDNGSVELFANDFEDVAVPLQADAASEANVSRPAMVTNVPAGVDVDAILREAGIGPGRDPRGARADLGGREAIIMQSHGPWDHEGLLLRRVKRWDMYDEWEVIGPEGVVDPRDLGDRLSVTGDVKISRRATSFAVLPEVQPLVSPYELRLRVPGESDRTGRGVVRRSQWDGFVFPWQNDPLEDLEGWRADGARFGIPFTRFGVFLPFGNDGPSDGLLGPKRDAANLPKDRFGITARSELEFGPGRWRVVARADDGIRVLLDGEMVIEDWSIHAPRDVSHEFTLERARVLTFEIEYFENTGYAWLDVDFQWLGPLEDE